MGKKLVTLLLCLALIFTMTSCNSKKKAEEEAEKARQEELKQIQQENEAAANAAISAIESLPENIKLKNETEVAGARALYDDLTDEQKDLVPEEMVTKLEDAEKEIERRKEVQEKRRQERRENKKAAKKAEEVIGQIPDNVTLDSENAVTQARAAYNELSEDQKKFVSKDSVSKLNTSEAKLQELKAAEEKKKEEAKKKAEEKKKETAKKKDSKKKDSSKSDNKYATAKKYVGKKASALIAAIGKPNKKKQNPNCATDGEEWIYYYDGFYVGVLSQDKKSPLIVQNVTKN